MESTKTARPWVALPAMFFVSVLGALLVVVGPGAHPAAACDCSVLPDAAAFEQSDAVFVGELVDYESPPANAGMSTDPATWVFEVSEVYKGDVAATQEVVSEVSGASCGLEIPREGEFLVFATEEGFRMDVGDDQYYAGLCGGTRSASVAPLDVDVRPSPPEQTQEATSTTVADRETDDAAGPTRPTSGAGNGLVYGIVAVGAVAVGAALLAWRRLGGGRS